MKCPSRCGVSPTRWLVLSVDGPPGKHAISYRCRSCGARRLQLGGVEDLEAAVVYVADHYLRQHRAYLPGQAGLDREEFQDFLTSEAWALWLAWQPERGVPFAPYLFRFLPLRANQFYRSQLGKDGHKQHIAGGLRVGDQRADGRLGAPAAPEQGDPALHSAADLLRVLSH